MLPLVIGVGLVILVVATSLILKSRNDQVTTITQEQTAESLSLAEGGMARTLGLLNSRYQGFLTQSYDPNNVLRNTTDHPNDPDAPNDWIVNPPPCFTLTDLTTGRIPANASEETYNLEAYRYRPDTDTGTLLVRSQSPTSGTETRLVQTIEISPSETPVSFPGVLAEAVALANTQVLGTGTGNVICTDSRSCSVPDTGCNDGLPTVAGLNTALGAQANSLVQGNIAIQDVILPPVPTPPICTSSNSPNSLSSSDDVSGSENGDQLIIAHRRRPRRPRRPRGDDDEGSRNRGDDDEGSRNRGDEDEGSRNRGDEDEGGSNEGNTDDFDVCGPVPTIAITGATELPRSGDPKVNGVYHYIVSRIDLRGTGEDLVIDTSEAPVYFYLSGDLNLDAGASIQHICTGTANSCGVYGSGLGSPERFHLYGQPNNADDRYDQLLTWSGASTTNIFLYAPDSSLAVTGHSSVPDIHGALWVGEWNGSGASDFELMVPSDMRQRLEALPDVSAVTVPRASKVIGWERRSVNN